MIQEDRRRRRKEHLIRTREGDFNKFDVPERKGTHHIEFRISPRAFMILKATARLFEISTNQYAKAVLYVNLGLIYEPDERQRGGNKKDE